MNENSLRQLDVLLPQPEALFASLAFAMTQRLSVGTEERKLKNAIADARKLESYPGGLHLNHKQTEVVELCIETLYTLEPDMEPGIGFSKEQYLGQARNILQSVAGWEETGQPLHRIEHDELGEFGVTVDEHEQTTTRRRRIKAMFNRWKNKLLHG